MDNVGTKSARDLERQKAATWKRLLKRLLVAVVGFGFLVLLLWALRSVPAPAELDVTKMCTQHGSVSMHIHPHLRIFLNGKEEPIPVNVGIPSSVCMRPIHTHDGSGTLHLEFPRPRDVKLGDFFRVWGKRFNKDCVLDSCVDNQHQLSMTVNGVPNSEWENYIMSDGDQIEIRYE